VDFDDLDAVVQTASREALPAIIGRLAQLHALALARLTRPDTPASGDRLLKIADAAAKLSVSPDYLYRHAEKLPFTVRDGRRLRFSEHGIEQWIARRRGFRKP
jgi:predicted DNA-binding transcriptional regulator AlpA